MADQPTQVPATAARPSDCVSKSSEESTSTAAEKTSLAKHYSSLESIEQHRRVIERCAEALRTTYKSTGSYVPMIPWVDDDSKHIDEIYSGLMLETEEGLTDSERRSRVLETYGEIFEVKTKNGDPIHIAILKGEPGRGKSTLVKKMAYDWAVYIRVLQKYKLVFVLKMHALEQGCDVIDAISDQLLPWLTSSDRRVLDLYIQDSSDKVLFLMDGFDELMTSALCESSFGSVFHVLHRKKYTGCSVVVTTRPSHYANLYG
ncbi:NACHT, LRR and PYD domains-containing protein 3-like [Acanthaster planci]|uniref:NACHT, LRR and PYD domains-containing protein 3-like n=1 Tax=Acanthaster planci TaxID=133434 RepID=A0A8B7ZPX3_ACAPL|nr:NACHT, LRR and PYD domains-containing protein 3-like [Acanthaster planci]